MDCAASCRVHGGSSAGLAWLANRDFALPFMLPPQRLLALGWVMDIEIVVIGESSKWVLNQSRIRIGTDPKCEVSLAAGRYPAVAGEHLALEVANGAIRLVKARTAGETYLNGHPADSGATLRSGDVLRLGAGGPELRVRVLEREASTEYEPTRMIFEPQAAAHEQTRMMHEPTRVISSPAATTYSPAPSSASAAGGSARQNYPTQVAFGGSASASSVSGTSASAYTQPVPVRRPDTGTQASYGQPRSPEPPPATTAAYAAESDEMRTLAGKLKSMQLILAGNLVVLLLLLGMIFLQGRELADTHKELQALRVQAATAMGQLTPSLDARLNVFEKRMDAMDQKVNAAQDRLVQGMDAQAKIAEDRLVARMNTEIPAMLDKYVAKKVTDMKH
jgi:ribosomal 50S subunit-recycling heat shock protein